MKTFQKPLSAEEEAAYIHVLKDGSLQEAKEAKDILVIRNMRLVAHIAKKYQNAEEDMEDLISIGTIGLIKAVDTFDAGKGRLATYACRCIENELLMMFRSRKKTSREVSLFESIGMDKEGNEINLLDVMEGQQTDVVEQMTLLDNIRQMYFFMDKILTKREKEILVLRYGILSGREMTQNEIGRKMGISRSYVSRIEKKALLKLKNEFVKIHAYS
ncbi:MAG: sigma-70 family RNA polymerase sigma factor [Lachnospiraceae bacterium]|nr:sigma-70 family RNA polymerase sigma factor [Lachnospiraceae bacterium]